jgi:hypothetical protein
VPSVAPDSSSRALLLADAVINLVLGGLLVVYPQRLVEMLGLPAVSSRFYPSVLGGVLVGIGVALFVAYRGGSAGLGLDGAIAINICGAGTVVGWLLSVPHTFSVAGRITLWVVAGLVLGIGFVELVHRQRRRAP